MWQETDLRETPGLAPCAFLTMWNVRNNAVGREFLDMCLIQRSGDMITASGAGGINEVQYSALLLMIARHCRLTPGVFTHFVANEQIYDRHETAAIEMMRRYDVLDRSNEPHVHNPWLQINPKKDNFYEFTIEDFEMLNYEPMKPQLKLELGI